MKFPPPLSRLRFVGDGDDPALIGRKLAISIYVKGTSGPLTWHAKGMTTSYITPQNSGDHTGDADDAAYPFSTTSWYFLDAVDVMADDNTAVVCAFGDSITDGTSTTINGDDRWSNDLSRRLHEVYGNGVSVVNEGIGGTAVINPIGTGPAAVDRLDRDVLGLSGLTSVVWLECINDLGAGHPVNEACNLFRAKLKRSLLQPPLSSSGLQRAKLSQSISASRRHDGA